jgi:hypothetical protein
MISFRKQRRDQARKLGLQAVASRLCRRLRVSRDRRLDGLHVGHGSTAPAQPFTIDAGCSPPRACFVGCEHHGRDGERGVQEKNAVMVTGIERLACSVRNLRDIVRTIKNAGCLTDGPLHAARYCGRTRASILLSRNTIIGSNAITCPGLRPHTRSRCKSLSQVYLRALSPDG